MQTVSMVRYGKIFDRVCQQHIRDFDLADFVVGSPVYGDGCIFCVGRNPFFMRKQKDGSLKEVA